MTEVMNLTQLASYLKMSKASLYHLLAAGKIPGTKVGKQWRFSRPTVDEWLQGSKQRSADILVVEDDLLIQQTVVKVLQEAGHQCVGAGTTARALSLLTEIAFDLVFIDMLLPDGTGLDIISAVMSTPKPPQMVIVTAHPRHELVDEARRLVPNITVLEKPVRLEALMELARTRVTR